MLRVLYIRANSDKELNDKKKYLLEYSTRWNIKLTYADVSDGKTLATEAMQLLDIIPDGDISTVFVENRSMFSTNTVEQERLVAAFEKYKIKLVEYGDLELKRKEREARLVVNAGMKIDEPKTREISFADILKPFDLTPEDLMKW